MVVTFDLEEAYLVSFALNLKGSHNCMGMGDRDELVLAMKY